MDRFIYVLGPTAVGKTQFSISLAESLQWPIINTDSLQVYKFLDIGTAKPSASERERVPHFLFDYIFPPQTLTAASYTKDVVACLKKEKLSHALFVGGSGFYIQALEKGLYPIAPISEAVQKMVENRIEQEGFPALYQWIQSQDPQYAEKMSANDHYRIKRALEVMMAQGKSVTELKKEMETHHRSPLPEHRALKIGFRMNKEDLLLRVMGRTEKMIQEGLIDEVRSLLTEDFAQTWAPLKSVGYKQVNDYLNYGQTLIELKENIITATMQLIKKQMTWFRRDPNILWFEPHQSPQALEQALLWSKQS